MPARGTPRIDIDPEAISRAVANMPAPETGAGGVLGTVGRVLGVIDYPRAALVSTAQEVVDAFQGEGFSASDWLRQTREHHGFGDIIADLGIDAGLGGWGNRILGFTGDVLLDPWAYAGGLGALARARGARGLVTDLTPLRNELTDLARRGTISHAQRRQLSMIDDGIAAASKTRSVSGARNAILKHEGGEALVRELGIETGLRFRIPGTGPVLGRVSRTSPFINRSARARAGQIPRIMDNEINRALPEGTTMVDLIKKASRGEKLPETIDVGVRQLARRAAYTPLDITPRLGGKPIAGAFFGRIQAGAGSVVGTLGASKFGQMMGSLFGTPEKNMLAQLRRAKSADGTPNVDFIVFGNFLENGYNRGATYHALWADAAQQRRQGFVNNMAKNFGITDQKLLGELTDISFEIIDDIMRGVPLSQRTARSLSRRFPTLDLETIGRVGVAWRAVQDADVEFLLRPDLYGNDGELARSFNQVLLAEGNYAPRTLSDEGRAILVDLKKMLDDDPLVEEAPDWVIQLLEPDSPIVDITSASAARGRATARHLQERVWEPAHVDEGGEIVEGTLLKVPHKEGSEVTERQILRPTEQWRHDMPEAGRPGARAATPDEGKGMLFGRDSTVHPEGWTVREQIDEAFRNAGWLDDADSMFKTGFAERETGYISSLSRDVRLRALENYAARQGLVVNAADLKAYMAALDALNSKASAVKQALKNLSAEERSARAAAVAARKVEDSANPRAHTVENIERWINQNVAEAGEVNYQVGELSRQIATATAEVEFSASELIRLADELESILGVSRLAPMDPTGVPAITSDPKRFTAGAAAESGTPLRQQQNVVNAVRDIIPLLEQLEPLVVRLEVIQRAVEESIPRMRQAVVDVVERSGAGAVGDDIVEMIDNMAAMLSDDIAFLEEALVPSLMNDLRSVMLADRTVVGLQSLETALQQRRGFGRFRFETLAEARQGAGGYAAPTLETFTDAVVAALRANYPNGESLVRVGRALARAQKKIGARAEVRVVGSKRDAVWELHVGHVPAPAGAVSTGIPLNDQREFLTALWAWVDQTVLVDADLAAKPLRMHAQGSRHPYLWGPDGRVNRSVQKFLDTNVHDEAFPVELRLKTPEAIRQIIADERAALDRWELMSRSGFRNADDSVMTNEGFYTRRSSVVRRDPTPEGEIRGSQGGRVKPDGSPDTTATLMGPYVEAAPPALMAGRFTTAALADPRFESVRGFVRLINEFNQLESVLRHELSLGLQLPEGFRQSLLDIMGRWDAQSRNLGARIARGSVIPQAADDAGGAFYGPYQQMADEWTAASGGFAPSPRSRGWRNWVEEQVKSLPRDPASRAGVEENLGDLMSLGRILDGMDFHANRAAGFAVIEEMQQTLANKMARLEQIEAALLRNQRAAFAAGSKRTARILAAEKQVLEIEAKRVAMEMELASIERDAARKAQDIADQLGRPPKGGTFNLNSFGGDVNLENVTPEMLQGLWDDAERMWGSWRIVGDQEFADQFTYAMLATQKMNDRHQAKGFLKAYDRMHNWLKAQMVATPGFVSRNLMGGMFNMWIDGIPLNETFRTALMVRAAYSEGGGDLLAGARTLAAKNPEKAKWTDMVELLEVGAHAGGQAASAVETNLRRGGRLEWIVGTKGGAAHGVRVNFNPMDAGFVLYSSVRHANTFAEETLRLATGLYSLRVGDSLGDSLGRVYRLHFNYGDLSKFEHEVGKRIFPFYTWTRNNIPLQLSMMAQHPARYNRLLSIKRNLEHGEEREGVVPDHFLKPFGIQLPFSIGGDQAYTVPDLPFQDLLRLDPTAQGTGEALEHLVSSASPMLKVPIEYWAGKQIFGSIPYTGRYQQVPVLHEKVPFLMPALEAIGWARKNSKGEWKMKDDHIAVIDNLLPYLGRWRRVIPNERRYQERYIQTLVSTLAGLNVRINTPFDQRNQVIRDSIERSLRQQEARDIEGRVR